MYLKQDGYIPGSGNVETTNMLACDASISLEISQRKSDLMREQRARKDIVVARRRIVPRSRPSSAYRYLTWSHSMLQLSCRADQSLPLFARQIIDIHPVSFSSDHSKKGSNICIFSQISTQLGSVYLLWERMSRRGARQRFDHHSQTEPKLQLDHLTISQGRRFHIWSSRTHVLLVSLVSLENSPFSALSSSIQTSALHNAAVLRHARKYSTMNKRTFHIPSLRQCQNGEEWKLFHEISTSAEAWKYKQAFLSTAPSLYLTVSKAYHSSMSDSFDCVSNWAFIFFMELTALLSLMMETCLHLREREHEHNNVYCIAADQGWSVWKPSVLSFFIY